MARNYAALYNSDNDSTAMSQAFFIKEETTRGTFALPAGVDYYDAIAGGSLAFSQPNESSPQRSDRHNTSTIQGKKVLDWNIPAYINIDTTLMSPSSNAVSPAFRLLLKSAYGFENVSAGAVYNASTEPSITFSIFQMGDRYASQARGCVVDAAAWQFPGDGRAQVEFSGFGVESFLVGIGKSTVANTGNVVTVQTGEGDLFPIGSQIMLIEANGTTRSADTPAGSARTVVSKAGDALTLSGAALTDADGSGVGAPLYVSYYEPTTKVAVGTPQTGLVGSFTMAGWTSQCLRSATVNSNNNHERIDYCYGHDAVDNKVFVPAGRLDVAVGTEISLNAQTVKIYNSVQALESQNVTIVLGNPSGRRLEIALPKVIYSVPTISVPETGSIPVTFDGMAYQTVLDAADEITVSIL